MNQLVESVKGLGPVKLGVIGASAALMLGFFVLLATGKSDTNTGYAPLFNGMSLQEGSKVTAVLDTMGVQYEIRGNGSQIYVPQDLIPELRMKLAGEGLPSSGSIVGYEIFDESKGLGQSNFVYNVNLVRALEGELGRTIGSFANVENARVHLVLPKRELFTRERQEPSASVVLKLTPGSELGRQQVAAIRHLVASAVPELKANLVTIVDSKGNLLARAEDDPNNPDLSAEKSDEYRVSFERRTRSTIEELLEKSVGFGKVKAQVSADIDFDRIVINSETFDPEGQVVRSVQTNQEREQSNEAEDAQNVTVANNLPDPQAGGAGSQNSSLLERNEETTNYEISKTVKNHIRESGVVKKISVAVLIDGTYTLNSETGEQTYTPRSEEELQKLTNLVKSAIGYDEARGDTVEVVNMQFSGGGADMLEESPMDWFKQDFGNILQTIVMGIVAILAILLVVKPLVNRAIEASAARVEEEEEMAQQLALEGPRVSGMLTDGSGGQGFDAGEETFIDIDNVSGKIKSSSIRKIAELIEKNPEETMGTLRSWMMESRE